MNAEELALILRALRLDAVEVSRNLGYSDPTVRVWLNRGSVPDYSIYPPFMLMTYSKEPGNQPFWTWQIQN